MSERSSPRVFEIIFRSPWLLRDVVQANPLLPLPPVSVAEAPQTLAGPDAAQLAREERQAIEQVLTQLRAAADQLGNRYVSQVAEMRQAAVELAVAVAGRLVYDKLQASEFPIEEMVRQAVARLPASPLVMVHLHPDDLSLLQRRHADQALLSSKEPEVRLQTDASLSRGACRAEAEEIHVLAELASQLAELRQHLLWSISHARSEPGPSAR